MRIIVVDDFGTMRQIVRTALVNLGFTDIVEARHGKEALDKIIANHDIAGKKIEMGIIDWNMPIMTGVQLLQKIREDKRIDNFIFLMLTAEQEGDKVVTALQSGVDEYLVKPFNHGTFKGKLVNIAKKKLGKIEKEIEEFFLKNAEFESKPVDADSSEKEKITEFKKRILQAGEIIPWSCLGPLALGRMYMQFKGYEKAEVQLRKAVSIEFGVAEAHKLLSPVQRQ
ncbi:MAG: hypothetical protein IEMM0002_1541 [bacterium]|nr:MAG: hypothetical protein IEMM0002_1541 [bacterium]